MKTILITGATGNVGRAVINSLRPHAKHLNIQAALRKRPTENQKDGLEGVQPVHFDFDSPKSMEVALSDCDMLFLLRPPQLADVKKYFEPLIKIAVEKQLNHMVFLSVQGAESSSLIPHHKIEKLILDSGLPYTFLRPAYFMQNFTTTLRKDIVKHQRIYLPAGKAKFTLIDVEEVGEVAAEVLTDPKPHTKKAYVLTNEEQLSFEEMTQIIREETQLPLTYKSPNLLSFFFHKWRKGLSAGYIFVLIMLHYFPRFQATPETSDTVKHITGEYPRSFREFVIAHRKDLQPDQ
ncbi:MAG: NmrA family NAD(P)-binding protein [Bacteroidetes bacterium]|jgi:uncharacterized protein YbjT (DUF2867 family)|nr:NmrA family NAD(P)-binding protein [Bacteroidota bacterium]